MYVGIAALNATEVSQENNSVYPMENPAKLSLNDSDHLHQLGFTTLIKQLYAQNRRAYSDNLKLVMDDEKNFDAELLQILGCLLHPVMNNSAAHDINEEEARRYIRDLIELKKSVKLLNPGEVDPLKMGNLTVKDFEQDRENRVALTNWLTYEDYKKLERRHPLFREQPFLNGNYSKFTFTRFVEVVGGAPSREEYLYYIRWPSSQLMHSLVDLSADGLKVRFDDIYVAFLNLFENISTSKLDTKTDSTQIEPPLLGPGGRSLTEAPINMLKKAILDYFLTKEGAFTQNLSLNLPGIGSKQTGSPLVPSDVVIVPDDQDAKRVLTDVYHTLYPESNADWKVVYGDDGYEYVGSSWTSDYYGIAHRDPAVWRNQNYVCRIWTRHRANIEFMKMYGKTYDEMFPGCTSILVNSVRAVEDQESDFDGDFERIGIAYLQDVIPYMKEYIEEAANNGFFRNDEFYAEKEAELRAMQPVPLEKLKRVKGYRTLAKMARNVRFSYLWDESKTLYYKYPEKLNYNLMRSKVSLERENIALLEAVEAKNDIGMLTNSMRQVNYVVDYLKNICEERPEELPFYISDEDQSAIIFIFQYLLLQRNGVRAVKADGSYGKLTFPALITNEPVRVLTDNEPDFKPARELFKKMLKEFDDEFHTELSNHYQIIIDICENFMISDIPGEGGGYKQVQVKGKADPFGRTHIVIPDAENIEPRFRNVMGLWYLISGSSYESFVGRHGEDALFRGIYDNTLSHVPQLKQVGEDLKHLIRKEA
jgi:hypothetical protein